MKNPLLFFLLLIFSGSILMVSCQSDATTASTDSPADAIDTTDIEYFLTELSSDKFLGRKPCSAGEEITIDFEKGDPVAINGEKMSLSLIHI